MCTAVILYRPGHPWPLVFAANRDEMTGRAWLPPGRHWPDRPEVVAGKDELAGGSWLGLNDHGVLAGILNRKDSLGPAPDKRSRGELVLDALDHADAADAADALARIDVGAYRPFNLVIADNRDALWLRNEAERGTGHIECFTLPEGLSILTERDRNDTASARIAHHLRRFEAAAAPDPSAGDWEAWRGLMASVEQHPDHGPESALTIVTDVGFGTGSGSLIALPAADAPDARPVWLFAAGRPDQTRYEPVSALEAALA